MNIVLTGFMATGKSSVGKILAGRLGWAFYDTDDMIEEQTGHSIADLFSKGGEEPFRELEAHTVSLVALMDKAVIATGGGAPLRASNMDELEKNGVVFCLTAKPGTVWERLRDDPATRPLLRGDESRRRIEELLETRRSVYARCRSAIATDGLSPEKVVERVLEAVPKEIRP